MLFYPNSQKTVIKTGKVPMYLRVVLNRRKSVMRLNIEFTPEELTQWDEKIMRFTCMEMSANILLNIIDKNFDDFRHQHSTKLCCYNARTIRDILLK